MSRPPLSTDVLKPLSQTWLRRAEDLAQRKGNPYGGVRYFTDSFKMLPSVVKFTEEERLAMAVEEFGPAVDPTLRRV